MYQNPPPTAAGAGAQPVDGDLTAIAALSTTAFGRALLALADGPALLTASGGQVSDSDLAAVAALTTTAYGRAFLALADQAALVALIPAYQPLDPDLTERAAVDPSALGLTLDAVADAAAGRNALGASAGVWPAESLPASTATPPRLLPLRDVVSILADTTQWERDRTRPDILRAKADPTFGADIANAISTPPLDWTITNSGAWSSAVVSGGVLTVSVSTAGATNWDGGTFSAGDISRGAFRLDTGRQVFYIHLSASALLDTDFYWVAKLQLTASNGENNMCKIGLHGGAVTGTVYHDTPTANGNVDSLDATAMGVGIWIRFEVMENGTVILAYAKTAVATDPRTIAPGSWTIAGTAVTAMTVSTHLGVTYKIGVASPVTGTTGTFTASVDAVYDDVFYAPQAHAAVRARGYAASSTAVAIAHVSESTAWLPDLTTMRLVLADAVNRLPSDAGAVTWGLVGSTVSLADCTAPATMEAAAALDLRSPADAVITTAKQYWKLWVAFTSTSGLQPVSIDLARIPGLYSAG